MSISQSSDSQRVMLSDRVRERLFFVPILDATARLACGRCARAVCLTQQVSKLAWLWDPVQSLSIACGWAAGVRRRWTRHILDEEGAVGRMGNSLHDVDYMHVVDCD